MPIGVASISFTCVIPGAETDFMIKDFTISEDIKTYGKEGLPSLKEVYAPYFDFGTAVTGNEVLDADRMAEVAVYDED